MNTINHTKNILENNEFVELNEGVDRNEFEAKYELLVKELSQLRYTIHTINRKFTYFLYVLFFFVFLFGISLRP